MEYSPGVLEKSLQSGAWVPTWADFSRERNLSRVAPCSCVASSAKGSSKEIRAHFTELPSEVQTGWQRWGDEGPSGVSGRGEGLMGCRFPGGTASNREQCAHLCLCPCQVGVGRGRLIEDRKCSKLRLPTGNEGHRLV